MKVVTILLLFCLLTTCSASLDLTTHVNGTGSMELIGPGNWSVRGVGEQNLSMNFSMTDIDFEAKI
jgi:hypothetical protein